jgi:hypothetical protein
MVGVWRRAIKRLERRLSGHISLSIFGRHVTIYGFNAMHVAVNVWTKRWGYLCFHPPVRCFGRWWPWYFYASPNGTPWAATFRLGPGGTL